MTFIVAIDGPVGSGKSSVARMTARANGLAHVDTGAIYRSITYAAIQRGCDTNNPDDLAKMIKNLSIVVKNTSEGTRFFVDDEDITSHIRSEEISRLASVVSQHAPVRDALMDLQRSLGRNAPEGALLEGRDIGTVVFPDADVKIFLTASEEERARRRYLELRARGEEVEFDAVLSELKVRDARDRSRAVAPLLPAADAIVMDTTDLNQEQVVQRISQYIEKAKNQ